MSACRRRGAVPRICRVRLSLLPWGRAAWRRLCGVEQGVAGGAGERLQLGVSVQLLEDVLAGTPNGGEAEPEIRGNRAVVEPLRHQGEDLLLAGGETVEQAATFVVVARHLVRSGQQPRELRRGNQHLPLRRAANSLDAVGRPAAL